MIDIKNLTIEKAHQGLISKEYTVQDLVDAYKTNAESQNKTINAFIEFFDDVDQAIVLAQKRIDEGTATMLTGIPMALKDNLLYKDHLVTAGSKILDGYTPA
jgi:aspartyl-tRNA(Asn)/glutamyl-tRNA(Gln) amidotransferase subunit A